MSTPTNKLSLEDKIKLSIDPSKSVVVTACAGSGKTWLLTSRILRIIINDWINPKKPKRMRLQGILAITFTNNAAAEIQERVRERLREIAHADESEDKDKKTQSELLEEIGIEKLPGNSDLKEMYRCFITKRPGLSIHTFHSWFNHLIQFLPWSERVSFHGQLADSPEQLRQLAWEEMLGEINDDGSEMAESMRSLLGLHKLNELRKILVQVINKRSEWFLHYNRSPEDSDAFEVFENKDNPDVPPPAKRRAKRALHDKNSDFRTQISKLLKCLGPDAKGYTKTACKKLREACEQNSPAGFYAGVLDALFEKKKNFRERKSYLKKVNHPAFTAIEAEICAVRATAAYEYNRHCTRLALRYAQQYARLKEREGVMDYSDMELIPLRALIKGSKDSRPLQDLFKRLEDTYAHILVDEFQDTNPAQWMMLRSWLEESEDSEPPKVFIVGDPKQSIYGWRGGNPKLLGAARDYLKEKYKGEAVSINRTRRCSQKVVDAVNEVFSNEGDWALDSFATHEVEMEKQKDGNSLVLCLKPEDLPPNDKPEIALRDPLDPTNEREGIDSKARLEGKMLADKIGKITKKGYVEKDIMLLHPTRTDSEHLIDTLAGQGLTCSLLDKSSRMDCLECQDMLALLHAIFDPSYGLMIAQVLRSPIFGVSEEDLWKVYQAGLLEKDGEKRCSWTTGLKKAKGSDNLKRAQEKLQDWRDSYLERKLPAHELLARCYQEANIIKRYVEAVPRDIAKRVALNLDWILNYSLEAQGGRLVLPSEYAAHLRELSEAGEETDLADEGGEVIRSLTVHGAKGLESEVVIVVNSDYGLPSQWDKLLVTWNLGSSRPSHLSFCRGGTYATEGQEQAWEEIKKDKAQERNNLLYVAMTRARQHLFFSKRPRNKGGGGAHSKWWDRINDCLGKPDEKELDKLQPAKKSSNADGSDGDKHRSWPTKPDKDLKVGKQNESDNEAKIKGTQRHNLLALILQNNENHEKVMDDNQLLHRRLLGIGKDRLEELHGEIKKILAPETEFGVLLAQVDKKKNPIECELSAIVDGEYKDQVKIRRIDCLLTTKDDVVWIIDFKTGGSAFEDEHKNEYDEQLRAYHSVVKGSHLKDKTIKMAIVDREGGMREVEPA